MATIDVSRYSQRLIQMLWNPEPKNHKTNDTPIWCLGRQYAAHDGGALPTSISIHDPAASSFISHQPSKTSAEAEARSDESHCGANKGSASHFTNAADEWPRDFLDDIEARIWLTYRSNFPPIPKSDNPDASSAMSFSMRLKSQVSTGGFTSDTGWGCMIRSGQCILANAIAIMRLGRGNRGRFENVEERWILSLFADDPDAAFSIHNFVAHGAAACNTFPGQWFGPSATARCIEALCNGHHSTDLKVYVTGDGPDVFEDVLYSTAIGRDGQFSPTLLLVGTRLGIDRITPVYYEALRSIFMMSQCVGIAGGRPSSSHYFIGTQGRSVFYLDPHHTRIALPYKQDPTDYTMEEFTSCHTRRVRCIDIAEMDPSMLIAFLILNEDDWKAWRHTVSHAPGKHIFNVADSQPSNHNDIVQRVGAVDEVETLDDEL